MLLDLHIDFSGGRLRWSGIPSSLKNFPQFVVIHTVKGFGAVNKAEVDVFLELSCFFYDPMDVDNLISGSSSFSKSRLNIWKFTVHVLLNHGSTVLVVALNTTIYNITATKSSLPCHF